ncbi:hypothetical protein SAMN05216412_104194 [Nitrosospira multiformis]|uniref:Uncharacterized protein n=1 Tax=Nitrosospira multiformis TaxID=1231 RepID=A0A1I0D1K7_9PROT|nr:hypothetical protein [Nitrosospira multiformis]SET25815.1 hypothetical protein SAMN05216412_104194 [Nitrosospira multiformis]
MKITRGSKIQGLILAAALSIGLGFVFPVSAQANPYILDINSQDKKYWKLDLYC